MDTNKNKNLLKSPAELFGGFKRKKDLRNIIEKKDINLLPRIILEQRRFDERFRKVCFIFVRALVLAVALISVPYIMMLSLTLDKNSLEKSINEITQIEVLKKQVADARIQLKSKQELITNLNKNDSVIAVILTTMEKAIPKSMYLTSVAQVTSELKALDGKAAGIQKSIRIKGVSADKDSIADFQKSLKDMNMYKSVFVSEISETDEVKQSVLKVSTINEYGDTVDKEIPVSLDFRIKVEFVMECILDEWR